MAKEKRTIDDLTLWDDAKQMIRKAGKDGVETVWDRLEEQTPHCMFCETGLSCSKCVMGPCRISAKGDKKQRGVCGADADLTVARNFGRFIAAGAASHSDHGRDLVETLLAVGKGQTKDYRVKDEAKLRRIAGEIGLAIDSKSIPALARELAETLIQDFGFSTDSLSFMTRVPQKRRELWEKLGITPRGIDRDVVEMMHRTHMGVDSDPVSLCLHSARVSLTDGWGGSMIGTELSDIIFGTPEPTTGKVNLGVLKEDQVNILVHGHSPIVSELVLDAARDPEFIERAKAAGAKGHQRRRAVLHGQRAADAPGHPHGRQPSDDRTGPDHRGRGDDHRGLPVHHAEPGAGGRLLPHQVRFHLEQGQIRRCRACGVQLPAMPGTGQEADRHGHRALCPARPGPGGHSRRAC
jgi:anaerobic carbon-monoxide dehydrogenase catalytic subunit